MLDEHRKKGVLLRLKRIEGQVRGLQRMVEQGVPCVDVLTQVASVTAAIKKTGRVIIQTSMDECLNTNLKGTAPAASEQMRDLREAIARYIDWA